MQSPYIKVLRISSVVTVKLPFIPAISADWVSRGFVNWASFLALRHNYLRTNNGLGCLRDISKQTYLAAEIAVPL